MHELNKETGDAHTRGGGVHTPAPPVHGRTAVTQGQAGIHGEFQASLN